jgi:ribonuclease P protein component
MFSRKNRITAQEVQKMFSSDAKTAHSEFFLLKKKANNLGVPRFAIIVPKKIAKTAVSRHKNKRKVISVIEKISPIKISDYVITLKTNFESISESQILSDLVKILI